MRKKYHVLKMLGVAFAILFIAISVNAQDNKEKPASSSFSPYWFLNGHVGFSEFYGDLNKFRFFQNPGNWNLGGGLYIGHQFIPMLGLRGELLYAGLGAEYDDKGMNMKGSYFEYNLNPTLSLVNLFSRYNPDRKFDIYAFGGIGQSHFRSTTKDIKSGPPGGYKTNDSLGFDGKGFGKRELLLVFPYGIGASYALSDNWDLTLETSARYTGTDKLDGWTSKKYDQYGITTLGVTYKFIGGVDLDKMAREFDQIEFTTIPEVLEMHGDSIRVTIIGKVPENYFHKKAAILFTPTLKYGNTEVPLKSINLLGEEVTGDGITIKREGGTFTYTDVIAYKPGMEVADLVVTPLIYEPKAPVVAGVNAETIKEYSRYVDGPQVKLADGVIITPLRILNDEQTMIAAHGYEKETIISREAVIYFQVDMHNLNWNLSLNRNQDAKQKIRDLEDFIRKGWQIRDIDVDAYASPEGEESHNIGLSERRSKTGLKYTHDLLKKLVREKNSNVKIANVEKDIKYNVSAHGEDWDGFVKAVQASDIKDKNVIINIVNSQTDPKKREQDIRNMSYVYKEVEKDILPPLRRVVVKVNVFEPKKTDDQIAQLAVSDPGQLTEQELLYAATMIDDPNAQLNIYKTAIDLFPKNYKGYNNAAAIEMRLDEMSEATKHLKKAEELGAGKTEVINNLGAMASKTKDYKKAEAYYNEARKLGANVDYNLGMLMIPKGNYKQALTSFGSKTCNHNVALAQMLSGNLAGANQNAKCAPEHAKTHYLLGVIAARANDIQGIVTNLQKAFAADAKLKNTAKTDREFIKFFDNSEFKALVQ